ncbi:damage-inducible protein DinB [Bradyrhizobium diazoefficiens]|nr:DinB family protein [Bradyrhizobium diazoefficiens]MBR0848279.1 damage-inducible protein DinB [Bradyrhizobium diazoefficiens]
MSAGLMQTYRAFAHNNAWANHRLLTACASLTQADFEAHRTGFFPSIQRTLNHVYVIDLFYIDALEGGWLGPRAWENQVPYPSLSELKAAQAAMDKRLLAACDALTPELLDGFVRINRNTRVQTERRDRLLMHLFQHQIHHRGQAHAMLSETNVAPPQLDEFFAEGEAPLRAAEFDVLGWTEKSVWRS